MSLELLAEAYSQEKFESFIKNIFKIDEIDTRFKSDGLTKNHLEHIDSYKFIGRTRLSDRSRLGFFVFKSKSKNIENKRVGFNAIIPTLTKNYIVTHALVAIFHEKSDVWRLSYVSFDIKDGKQSLNTTVKRYTYELGSSIPIRTAKAQIGELLNHEKITKKLLEEVFSVEKLNNRFFADYKRLFEKLNGYLFENNFANFQRDKSNIRAFSKKLLGRITFLYFLQKKGWLGVKNRWGDGDKDFLRTTFKSIDTNKNFYEDYLKDIFFEGLSKKRLDDKFELLNCKIPFLNGGLFEKKEFDNEFLMIDNTLFDKIFKTLSYYNFTIVEDTPHESEVAVDPEMLGKVFENLLEENYKSGKGTFYTPKEIVHYMCKESIYEYLLADFLTKKEAIRELVFDGVLNKSIDKNDILKIKEKIQKIKILDPAIGSGAFPMGLLMELIHILEMIDKKLDVVQAKIDIIQNSIHGIDIDASAVEIAQLRFWLSIVVDDNTPRALPNLDFKIMIGNSLLDKIYGDDPLKNRKGLDEKLNHLNRLFRTFYNTHENKNQIKEKISKKLNEIFNVVAKKYSNQPTMENSQKEYQKKLLEAYKAKSINDILKDIKEKQCSDKIFLYKLFFKEAIDNGGFNIVIGNPPYLRVQGIDKEVSEQYKKQFASATGSYDLYVLFVEKGLSLLAKDGILNYIMPHKWINSAFGKGLRNISKDNIFKFISFGAYQVFNASTYTSLVWFKKSKVKILDYVESDRDLLDNKALEKYLFGLKDDDFTHIKNSELTKESWVFTDKKTYEVLQKLNRQPLRVKDIFEKIFQGIATSKDSVYFLKDCRYEDDLVIAFSDELKKEIKIEKGLVKPLLKGGDVHRYKKLKSDKVVVFPYIIKEEKAILYKEDEIKKKFPYGYAYLKECEDILRGRERGRFNIDGEWFQFGRKQALIQNMEKIITAEISIGCNMMLDNHDFYINTKNYSLVKYPNIKESYKFYLAILNSKLMWFFIKNTGYVLSGGYYTFKTNYLNPFPIPKIENIEDTKPFEILVDYIMLLKTLDKPINEYVPNSHIILQFEEVIDAMVYELYFKEEFESKLIQFEKEKGYIKFIEYAKEDYASIEGLDEVESIEVIHQSYQTLREPYNKIRNNLILIDIHFPEFIKPIKESL